MIKTKAVIEILGTPKEHVESTLEKVIEQIKKDYKVLSETTYKAEEIDKLWSSFADLKIEFPSPEKIFDFCFDFMPSSIEIISPDNLQINALKLTDNINDLIAKLHKYDMFIKNLRAENILLKRKTNSS